MTREIARSPRFAAMSAAIALTLASPLHAEMPSVKELLLEAELLADFPEATFLHLGHAVISKSLRRVALVQVVDGKQFVVEGGTNMMGPYERVFERTLAFTSTGSSLSFVAQRQKEIVLNVDGKETPIKKMLTRDLVWNPHISPSGKRLLYAEADDKQVRVVVNGKIVNRFDRIGYVTFANDDTLILTGQVGCSWFLWRESKRLTPGYPMISEPRISSDASAVFTMVTTSAGRALLRNGKVFKASELNVIDFSISPDGTRTAVLRDISDATGLRSRIEITGLAERDVEGSQVPLSIAFSANGKAVAYVVNTAEGTQLVNLNGIDGLAYAGVGDLTFSATGDSFAYLAVPEYGSAIVVNDGHESARYGGIPLMVFSDGPTTHFGYVAMLLGDDATTPRRYTVVVDNQASESFLDVRHFGFSPGGTFATYVTTREAEGEIVRELHMNDAIADLPYDFIPLDPPILLATDHIEFVARKGTQFYRVTASATFN